MVGLGIGIYVFNKARQSNNMRKWLNIAALINKLEYTGIDISGGSGQLEWIKKRSEGKKFSFEEHVRGLLYAQLSNQRQWKPIQEKLVEIDGIFFNYDIDKICNTDSLVFVQQLRSIKCGNRSINQQIASLRKNIYTLKHIESKYGDLDSFVSSDDPYEIGALLSNKGEYKILYLGIALSMEYLKNVGIEAVKPDVHIRRMLGSQRLGFIAKEFPSEKETIEVMKEISNETHYTLGELDTYLWMYCASGYCEICGTVPKCDLCVLCEQCCMYKNAGNSANANLGKDCVF